MHYIIPVIILKIVAYEVKFSEIYLSETQCASVQSARAIEISSVFFGDFCPVFYYLSMKSPIYSVICMVNGAEYRLRNVPMKKHWIQIKPSFNDWEEEAKAEIIPTFIILSHSLNTGEHTGKIVMK